MKNKIAVIMSVYKKDKLNYLQEALESLYSQTYKEFDIFIQCDGSLPYNLEKYLDHELKKNRIFYLRKREKNRGLAFSLNELLEQVLEKKYNFIVRMDADDISVSTRIEQQYNFMENNPNVDVCGSFIEEFNMDTNVKQIIRYKENVQMIKEDLLKHNPMAHVTICFRNSFFDTISGYDIEKLNEDLDLWIKALKQGIILHNLQEVLVYVRTDNAFLVRRKNIKRAFEVMCLKYDASKTFGFGLRGYIYALLHFLLFMSPSWLKHYIYKNFRG